MKKTIIALALGMVGFVPLVAQTNFRHISFEEAVKQAKAEKRLLFVDFYTDWCGPCRKMAQEVFPQKKVGDFFNEQFVCIKLNAEKEGKELAKRYSVKVYPTFLVIDDKEQVKATITGAASGEAFIEKVKKELNPELTPERMKERYDKGERTPELINAYAMSLLEKKKMKEGFEVINGYFASLTDKQKLAKENFFLYTLYTTNVRDEKAEYLLAHVNECKGETKQEALKVLQKLYYSELLSYLSGHYFASKQYNQEAYQEVKNTILSLKLDKEYPFQPLFDIVECYAKGDMRAHFELVKSKKKEMAEKDFELILLNVTRLYPNSPELIPDVIGYIRSSLPELKAANIMMMGQILMQLEKK